MSRCAEFRVMILEAEPGELRAEGEGPLAVHLRDCPDCARAAALVLEESARLDEYLGDAPAVDVDAILQRAAFPAAATAPIETRPAEPEAITQLPPEPKKVVAPGHRSFPGRRLWVPLAAAAAIAALLLIRVPDIRRPATSVASSPTGLAVPPLVEPVAGQDAAIMQTDDPEITVVWLFSTG